MKTIYILLTRSGTLLSNLVYAVTGANYTHASLAFDEDLSCLYSSTRKNGYTMFPAGPSREYLNRGVFRLRENVPCALYALDVSDEAYTRARRRAEHMMAHGRLYQFNVIGLALCGMHIRWKRRRHYFCSQFVSEVLEKSGAMELPKHSTLMHPNDYTRLEELRCVYKGTLAGLPQRQQMEYLNRGVFRLRENVPCALYALDVSDEAYTRARRRAEHMMAHGRLYQFNVIGLALCGMHIRWKRRRHYFCSQFVSEVLEKSGAMELPKHSTLMHPNDYTRLEELRCVYKGTLAGLPQRRQMEFDQNDTVIGVYLGLALGLFHTGAARVRAIF